MILGMVDTKITCNNCGKEITTYFHKGYNGKRGKCTHCKLDFPLE